METEVGNDAKRQEAQMAVQRRQCALDVASRMGESTVDALLKNARAIDEFLSGVPEQPPTA